MGRFAEWFRGRERLVIVGLILLFSVVIYFVPVELPIEPSASTKAVHEAVTSTPADEIVLLLVEEGNDYSRGLRLALRAFLEDVFGHGLRVVAASLYNDGQSVAVPVLDEVASESSSVENGRDYVWLGSLEGGGATLSRLLSQGNAVLGPTDPSGHPWLDDPVVQDFSGGGSVALLAVFTGNDDAGHALLTDVAERAAPGRITLVAGLAGAGLQRPQSMSVQGYAGVLAGEYGAAEYEELLGRPGPAQEQLRHVAVAAVLVSLLILAIAASEALRFSHERREWRARVGRQGRFGNSDRER